MFLASKQKIRNCEIGNEDSISRLPDALLCHILSFVPMKYAFRTSILSRRWSDIWISVPNINIADSHRPFSASFARFMNRFMVLRSHAIKRFRLILWHSYSSSEVETWIWTAIVHNVEEIDLGGHIPYLPRALFRSESLKVLKLSDSDFDVDNFESVCMPSLKVLHFTLKPKNSGFGLYNFESVSTHAPIEKLLNASPVIEELLLDGHDRIDVPVTNVNSSSLKSLNLYGINHSECTIVIDAPNLESFQLSRLCDVDIRNSSSIFNAIVDVYWPDAVFSDKHVGHYVQLVNRICNVKVLALSLNALLAYFDASNQKLPCFPNLTQLEMRHDKIELRDLLEILGASPNLKVLILKQGIYSGTWKSLDEEVFEPWCLTSSLEMVEFICFEGSPEDMKIVGYILRHSKVLKEIRISICYGDRIENESDVQLLINELLMLPRESNKCEILVS